jgi:thioredoxin-like negative regulator of GroEL
MLRDALALMLAVRCQQEEAAKQLLARLYHSSEEQAVRAMMIRMIYLLSAAERDWLRNLA